MIPLSVIKVRMLYNPCSENFTFTIHGLNQLLAYTKTSFKPRMIWLNFYEILGLTSETISLILLHNFFIKFSFKCPIIPMPLKLIDLFINTGQSIWDASWTVNWLFLYFIVVHVCRRCVKFTLAPLCLCDPGDAVWHAGGRSSGLAEEHSVSTLHQEQQTDHLVLAGKVPSTTHTRARTQIQTLYVFSSWESLLRAFSVSSFAAGKRSGQRSETAAHAVCHWNVPTSSGRLRRTYGSVTRKNDRVISHCMCLI